MQLNGSHLYFIHIQIGILQSLLKHFVSGCLCASTGQPSALLGAGQLQNVTQTKLFSLNIL